MTKFTQRTSETPTEMMFSGDHVSGYCFLSTAYLSGSVPGTPLCIISLTPHICPGSGTDHVDGNSKTECVSNCREIKSLLVSEPEHKFVWEKTTHSNKEWKYNTRNNQGSALCDTVSSVSQFVVRWLSKGWVLPKPS